MEREFIILYCPSHYKHAPIAHALGSTITIGHVETPRRAECIFDVVKTITENVRIINSEREASFSELSSIHDSELITFILNAYESQKELNPNYSEVVPCVSSGPYQKYRVKPKALYLQAFLFCHDYSTPIGEFTGIQASKSAALAIDGAKELLSHKKSLVFALCRPPGHHASVNTYSGYCYFNNAALAAEVLKSEGLVVILDIDYHHGNGTQDIFYTRNDVCYISIHADPEFEFPYYSGSSEEKGEGNGLGFNFNYPLPAGTDYSSYRPILEEVIEKIRTMDAKSLIISFGSDTAKGDPICTFNLVSDDYYDMGYQLNSLNLPTLVVQEGGYSDDVILGDVEEAFFAGLLRIDQ